LKNEYSIQNLLNRISAKSDEKAFRDLFDIFAPRLIHFSNAILKNNELAEEVVSDVFFKVWVHREKLSAIDNFRAYLYTSAKNTSLNYLDKEKRLKFIHLEDLSIPLQIDDVCSESDLVSKELKDAIEKAIDHLPSRCKLIYRLAKIDQLKYKEISQLLNISVKTIDNQIFIAIKKIGEEIKKYLNDNNESDNHIILLQLFIPGLQPK
jgi:RNA polymerase sigma-70 factor (ECF subfamily)